MNQFPAGNLWDEYDKAQSRIGDLEDEVAIKPWDVKTFGKTEEEDF